MLEPVQVFAIMSVFMIGTMYLQALENHILRKRLKSEGKPSERPKL